MDPLKFQELEEKIEKLISRIHILEEENNRLKEEKQQLLQEIEHLKSFKEDTFSHVDRILEKLSFLDKS